MTGRHMKLRGLALAQHGLPANHRHGAPQKQKAGHHKHDPTPPPTAGRRTQDY